MAPTDGTEPEGSIPDTGPETDRVVRIASKFVDMWTCSSGGCVLGCAGLFLLFCLLAIVMRLLGK